MEFNFLEVDRDFLLPICPSSIEEIPVNGDTHQGGYTHKDEEGLLELFLLSLKPYQPFLSSDKKTVFVFISARITRTALSFEYLVLGELACMTEDSGSKDSLRLVQSCYQTVHTLNAALAEEQKFHRCETFTKPDYDEF